MDGITTRFLALATGIRVRVAETGPANGAPVVLLHGWGASIYSYRHAFTALPPNGMRVIAVDLRGYGLSDHPRTPAAYRSAAYEQDLLALLDALGLARAMLVGHSMGGAVALRVALSHPERVERLVLLSSAALGTPRLVSLMRAQPIWLADLLGRRLVPRAVVAFVLRHIAYGDPARVSDEDVEQYWLPTRERGYVYAARACLSEFDWSVISREEAQRLSVPSLVILGARDRLIPNALAAAESLRGGRVEMVDAGHCVHELEPARVYARMSEFLRG